MSTLRSVPGVRTVDGSGLTGSVRIEYDPFRLAESALVDVLRELDRRLDVGGRDRPTAIEPTARLDASSTPLIRLAGATTVLALAATEVVSWPLLTALILAADGPTLLRGRTGPIAWSTALWYAHGLFRDYALPTREG